MSDTVKFIRTVQNYILPILCIVLFFSIVYLFWPVFMPFLLSFIVAYLLNPAVDYLEYKYLNRTASITLVYFLITIILFISIMFLFPVLSAELDSMKEHLPTYLGFLQERVNLYESKIQNAFPYFGGVDISGRLVEQTKLVAQGFITDIPDLIGGVFSFLYIGILIPFITFFLLKDGFLFRRAFIGFIPNRHFEMVLGLIFRLEQQIGGYIRAKLLQMIIISVTASVGLLILDVPYAIFIGIFAGVTNIVPYVGPIAGAIPAVIITFVIHQTTVSIVPVIILFGIVQLLDNLYVQPIVIGKSINMHPLLTILSLTLGGYVAGIWGMILGIPLFGMLSVTTQEFYKEIRYRLSIGS